MHPDPWIDFVAVLFIAVVSFFCGVLAVARSARARAEERARQLAREPVATFSLFLITCPQPTCGHSWSWKGTWLDCPPCPRCGFRLDTSELAELKRQSERVRESLPRREDSR